MRRVVIALVVAILMNAAPTLAEAQGSQTLPSADGCHGSATVWGAIEAGCGGAGANPATPAQLGFDFIRTMTPPSTSPSIAPGHAITGKPAYLEQATTTATQTFDTILGPLTITLQATTFTVDWGDRTGRDPGPYPSPGGPWPDGPARHTYTTAGTYTITITQTWNATWTVAGQTSPAPLTVTSTDRIPNFEARQLQAVRDR